MTAPTRPLENKAPFSVFFSVIVVVSFLSVPFQLRAVKPNTCVWRCSTLDFLTSSQWLWRDPCHIALPFLFLCP